MFDLDGTLTTADTFLPILTHYGLKRRKYLPLVCLPAILSLYALRFLSARSAKEMLLRLFFLGDRLATAQATISAFLDRWLPSRLHAFGMERLRFHQERGHRVILLSASPSLYVPLIAARLGIDQWLCTQVEVSRNLIEGRILGENLSGPAKVCALNDALADVHSPVWVVAYGNSRSDRALLQQADEGVLVTKPGRATALSTI